MWETRDKKEAARKMLEGHTKESYSKMAKSQKIRFENMTEKERDDHRHKARLASISYHTDPKFEQSRKERSEKISLKHKLNVQKDKAPYIERMLLANSKMHDILRNMTPEELDKYLSNSFLRLPKIYSFRYKGQDYGVRSSYEEAVLKALVDLDISFKYEPTSIVKKDGKYYRPDFLVKDTIIEVKSTYWLNRVGLEDNELRKEAVQAHGWSYLLLTEDEIFNSNLFDILKSI